jgi:hypothetical protein
MQTRHVRRLGALVAAVEVGATGVVSVGGAAGKAADDKAAKIKMIEKDRDLLFKGPKKVESGDDLEVVNKTEIERVGPHTFTLVKRGELPQTKKESKDCERFKAEFCVNIAEKHKVDLETGEVAKPSLDYGKKGWDKSFGKRGDSWFTDELGDSQTRVVSAKSGATLYYFCVVHPFMQGKLKVK